MSRRAVWILPMLALAAVSRAQEPADDERVDDPRGSPAVREALAERLITCVEAEGSPPSPADREVIRDVSVALAATVTRARCEDLSDGPGDACAARIRGASCESLVASLGPAGMAPATAPWAEALARALAARVLTCATAERDGGPLAPEDREAITAFEQQLSRALSGLSAGGVCAVNENLLPTCAASVAATGCEGLDARLDEDPAALARTLTPACQAMVRCGAALLDDGGGDEATDAASEDAW